MNSGILSELPPNNHTSYKALSNKVFNNIANDVAKRILVVDDQEINIKIGEKLIKSLAPNVIIEKANNGQEALSLIKDRDLEQKNQKIIKSYDLIITDIQMPVMDGLDLAKNIRKFNKEIPVIAYTSRTSFKIKKHALEIGFDDYVTKPIPNKDFKRVVNKWLTNNHNHNYTLDDIKDSFKSKKVLLADDEPVNCIILERLLKKYGMDVEVVGNGIELVNKYKAQFSTPNFSEYSHNNLDHKLDNKYDIIITDINMPTLNGDKAVRRIREFEIINNINSKAIIITNSCDDKKQDLHRALKYGVDDYFIKGQDNKKLLKTIYFWLSYDKNNNKDNSKKNITKPQEQPRANHNEYKSALISTKLEDSELKELREEFIKSSTRLINNIERSYQLDNIKKLAIESHALKGISGNMGTDQLYNYVTLINDLSKRNTWPKDSNWLIKLKDIATKTIIKLNKI